MQLRELTSQLDDNEERLLFALEAAEIGIWDWYIKEDRLVWDNQMLRIWDINKEEFNGTREIFQQKVHPEDIQGLRDKVAETIKNKSAYHYSYRVKNSLGYYITITAKGKVSYDESGEAYRMTGVAWVDSDCPRYTVCPVRKELMEQIRNGKAYPLQDLL